MPVSGSSKPVTAAADEPGATGDLAPRRSPAEAVSALAPQVILTSTVGTGFSALVIIVILLVIGLWYYSHRVMAELATIRGRRRSLEATAALEALEHEPDRTHTQLAAENEFLRSANSAEGMSEMAILVGVGPE